VKAIEFVRDEFREGKEGRTYADCTGRLEVPHRLNRHARRAEDLLKRTDKATEDCKKNITIPEKREKGSTLSALNKSDGKTPGGRSAREAAT